MAPGPRAPCTPGGRVPGRIPYGSLPRTDRRDFRLHCGGGTALFERDLCAEQARAPQARDEAGLVLLHIRAALPFQWTTGTAQPELLRLFPCLRARQRVAYADTHARARTAARVVLWPTVARGEVVDHAGREHVRVRRLRHLGAGASASRRRRDVDSSFTLHWISRDPSRDRLGMAAGGPAPVVRLARFDTTAGALRWDERLRERPDRPLGVSCDRKRWPGGAAGGAEPHGAIFSRR
jgi:hypothetical protein